jgi:hypothetical protein
MGVRTERHAPAASPPGKRAGTYCIGGWVGIMSGLSGCRKSSIHRDPIPERSARSDFLYRLSYPST